MVVPFNHSHQPSAISHDPTLFGWWRDADRRARHAFVAAALGWMLDSFDVMLYAMVGAALINDPKLHLSFQTNGLLGSITQPRAPSNANLQPFGRLGKNEARPAWDLRWDDARPRI